MTPEFSFEIVTPERQFFSGNVEMVVLKTPDGEMGILPGHIPMVVAVAVGPVKIIQKDKEHKAFLSEGFMEITEDKTIIVADSAEWPEEIDINRAKAAKMRAEERLRNKLSYKEYTQTQAALARAMQRLKIKNL